MVSCCFHNRRMHLKTGVYGVPVNCKPKWRVHEFARLHLHLRSDQMKDHYDSCIGENQPLKKGDPVWLYWPQRKKGFSPKLMRSWKGPYAVVKKINDLIYWIQLGPHAKQKVVHWNRLWLCKGPSPPAWMQDNDNNNKQLSRTRRHNNYYAYSSASQNRSIFELFWLRLLFLHTTPLLENARFGHTGGRRYLVIFGVQNVCSCFSSE